MRDRPILVTGAAGKTGRAVLKALAGKGKPLGALVRRADQQEIVGALGAREILIGDLLDPGTLTRPEAGSSAVYLICPNVSPDELRIGRNVIEACKSAGVPRLVYHSVLHPQIEAMPHHWAKLRVEELLIQSGLAFTILQPAAYMQNLLTHWPSITERGVYPIPYAPETRIGMVDLRDVAEVAAKALTEAGHEGATYELATGETLSQTAVAEALSVALGRTVRLEVMAREDWASRARSSGLGEYQVETLLSMFRYYESHGFAAGGKTLSWLLGRRPRTFSTFLADVLAGRA